MSDLLFFDSLESLKLIRALTSTIDANLDVNPDGFNMVKNKEGFQRIQSYSRSFIRNFFAYVEGTTFLMRFYVIEACDKKIIQLDNKTIAKLQEKEFDNVQNIVGEKNKFNSFKENLNLSFKHFGRTFGSDFKLNKSCEGWEIFNEMLKSRNQIMHPKSPAGYILKGETIKNMHKGAIWFTESTKALINSCAAAIDKM